MKNRPQEITLRGSIHSKNLFVCNSVYLTHKIYARMLNCNLYLFSLWPYIHAYEQIHITFTHTSSHTHKYTRIIRMILYNHFKWYIHCGLSIRLCDNKKKKTRTKNYTLNSSMYCNEQLTNAYAYFIIEQKRREEKRKMDSISDFGCKYKMKINKTDLLVLVTFVLHHWKNGANLFVHRWAEQWSITFDDDGRRKRK